jgi:glycosyltransferase involved in cell wall biosynthesis
VIGGNCQKPIADAYPEHLTVEFGIGYEGVFSRFLVFESAAWRHHVYGLQKHRDGHFYDAVIPNYFDPDDFYVTPPEEKEDYYFFIGRLVSRKGPHIAAQVCQALGKKLVVAGQGVVSNEPGKLCGKEICLEGNIEYVGVVDVEERARLMSRAKAVFVPTLYIGPFEGVHVEAMLSGTPVITTDWGCFTETFTDGVHGFRPWNFKEFVTAAERAPLLDGKVIREHAVKHYSLEAVAERYHRYFQHLYTLWSDGWYSGRDELKTL